MDGRLQAYIWVYLYVFTQDKNLYKNMGQTESYLRFAYCVTLGKFPELKNGKNKITYKVPTGYLSSLAFSDQ